MDVADYIEQIAFDRDLTLHEAKLLSDAPVNPLKHDERIAFLRDRNNQ